MKYAIPPPRGKIKEFHFPKFEEEKLRNGLTVIVVENRKVPRASISIGIKTGLTQDEADLPGIASLTAYMLKEGTKTRPAEQIAEDVDYIGGIMSLSGSQDFTRIAISAPNEYFSTSLDILADIVLNPIFPRKELEKLRSRELSALKNKNTQPRYLAQKIFAKQIYKNHPYSMIDTTPEVLKRITRKDTADFHRKHYNPSKSFIVVVGDIDRKKILPEIKKKFLHWSYVEKMTEFAPELDKESTKEVYLLDYKNAVQSNILIGNFAVQYNHPDYIPLLVTNQILGGSPASRLFMNLREEKGYTYGAYSRLDAKVEAALFKAGAAVRNEVTEGAIKEFFNEFNKIRDEKVPDEDLKNAKSYLTGIFPLSLERIEDIANHILSLKLYGLPSDYWNTYREKIEQVSIDDVEQMALKYIQPDKMFIVIVGESERLRNILSQYGRVKIVDSDGRVLNKD